MKEKIIKITITSILVTGCTWGAPKDEDRSPVKYLGIGEYIYDFKYSDNCIGDYIKQCGLHSMQQHNLKPIGCITPEAIRGGKTENGWAYVIFRCK